MHVRLGCVQLNMTAREQWTRRFAIMAVAGFAGFASFEHEETTLIAILVIAIAASVVIISENA
jgi:hypothetical protein